MRLCWEVVFHSESNRRPWKRFCRGPDLIRFKVKAHAECCMDTESDVCLPSCTVSPCLTCCLLTYTCLCPFRCQLCGNRGLVHFSLLYHLWLEQSRLQVSICWMNEGRKEGMNKWMSELIQEQANEWSYHTDEHQVGWVLQKKSTEGWESMQGKIFTRSGRAVMVVAWRQKWRGATWGLFMTWNEWDVLIYLIWIWRLGDGTRKEGELHFLSPPNHLFDAIQLKVIEWLCSELFISNLYREPAE